MSVDAIIDCALAIIDGRCVVILDGGISADAGLESSAIMALALT